ncbi:hypothetical protein ANCDUO_09789 [Ancylostoma duodenale]|uniref:Uncharacterized protein n=1 Tax=Ancylostoma duodenale TaxID=51022 RepID=A0A0C2CSX2_9BILA|nr:hypothetical protein ANCDUO_09789 [Ancylostoma duodenale]
MLSVSVERTESTGQLWLARGTNGRIAGARSVYPMINGSQDAWGDEDMVVNFSSSGIARQHFFSKDCV